MISLKINKSALVQYALIYLMLIWDTTYLFRLYLAPYRIIILAVMALMIATHKRLRNNMTIIFLIFLLAMVVIVRMNTGGVGMNSWIRWCSIILIAEISVRYEHQKFIDRYLNIVYFLALASVIGWIITQISPDMIRRILPASYYLGTNIYTRTTSYGHGLFIYSFNEWHPTRNVGIFSEPGVFQMSLNSALFVLLFMEKYVGLTRKKQNKMFIVFLMALITCQSTTGYIGLIVILLAYLIKNDKLKKRKYQILGIGLVGLLLVFVDYSIRGPESFLNKAFFGKLFSAGTNTLDLEASTGQYRMGTIMICLGLMFKKPFGIGYDAVTSSMIMEGEGLVAAQIMCTGAALGIITFIGILIWLFTPVLKAKYGLIFKVLYVFLYFNTALAQSNEFYGALIFIPLFLSIVARNNYSDGREAIKIVPLYHKKG